MTFMVKFGLFAYVKSERRPVCDQDVRVAGKLCADGSDLLAVPVDHEGPAAAAVRGLPRRAVDLDAIDDGLLILQVCAVSEKGLDLKTVLVILLLSI